MKFIQKIFGALCDALSACLQGFDSVVLAEKPRLADFAKWVTAAESTFGWETGSFVKAFLEYRNEIHVSSIDSDEFAQAVIRLANRSGGYSGSGSEMLTEINKIAGDDARKSKGWPKMQSLKGRLMRLAPVLRAQGIHFDYEKGKYTRTYVLKLDTGVTAATESETP